ncbi:MAG TPA: HgcAB-associated protein [Methanomassiliicoccales archaeon]|nr:HgcAB-associated protein [Methanomassiliicoccales archaeon]
MVKNKPSKACCPNGTDEYQVDAIVTLDERGQILLPKGLRDMAGFRTGDKLAVVTRYRDGKVCCLNILKALELSPSAEQLVSSTGSR